MVKVIIDAEYHRKWYHNNKSRILEKKKILAKERRLTTYDKLREYCLLNPCSICGEDDYIVLDFDHLDGETKKDSISNLVRKGYGWDSLLKEIEKCRVLCSNCHRRHTAVQLGWYKSNSCIIAL